MRTMKTGLVLFFVHAIVCPFFSFSGGKFPEGKIISRMEYPLIPPGATGLLATDL